MEQSLKNDVILNFVLNGLKENPESPLWHSYFGKYVEIDITERKRCGQLSFFEKFVISMENFGLPFMIKVGSVINNTMNKHLHGCACKMCKTQKETKKSNLN